MSVPQDWKSLDGPTLQSTLQEYCVAAGISDIHFSPEKGTVRLEVRKHGILEEIAQIDAKTYEDVLRRIKFAAKLKLNISDVPQDGQYTFAYGETTDTRTVNVRIATIPSRFGEKLTMRLLDPLRGIVPLQKLGLPQAIEDALKDIVQAPNGLFLITGPTGSGKTTTLYALLKTIVGKERNIVTLEDPIEYELEGIVQSQIDPEHDFTFSSGLRAALRHDPDVILVGEIRDYETAQTAVDASLTGHLVLSTIHTNSAIEAIPRLLAMGVSPYTLGPALRGVLAQRLVRTLKPECRKKKCDPNDNENYDGRTALAELLLVTPAIKTLIESNESADAILKKAQSEGFKTMDAWADELLKEGVTTEGEIGRVTG